MLLNAAIPIIQFVLTIVFSYPVLFTVYTNNHLKSTTPQNVLAQKNTIKKQKRLPTTPIKRTAPTKKANKITNNSYRRMDNWSIAIKPGEQAVFTTLSGNQLLNVQGPSNNVLFVSKDYVPVSVSFVKDRIKEWGGDKKSLKIKKFKGRSIFSFRVQNHVHWFSSEGGYLLATVDNLNQAQYLSLLKRVTNKRK